MRNKIALIILTYNSWEETIDCINPLIQNQSDEFDIFLVDNNSNKINNTLESLNFKYNLVSFENNSYNLKRKEEDSKISIILSDKNYGYAKGNNLGVKYATSIGNYDYILILNNDTLIETNTIIGLRDSMVTNKFDVISPKVINENESVDRNCVRKIPRERDLFFIYGLGKFFKLNSIKNYHYSYEYKFDTIKTIEAVSGSCFMIKTKLFKEINFFDENTFLYYEEFIMSEKLLKNDSKIGIDPKYSIIHKAGKSTSKSSRAFIKQCHYDSFKYYISNYKNNYFKYMQLFQMYLYTKISLLKK
jgi:GT2 family glycosyltransferase